MARSQPIYASCNGGLALNSNKFDLLNSPGAATKLRNYEVSLRGGYRRINGYVKFGGSSATRPWGTEPILGVHPYALGVVVVVDEDIYYGEDGITWLQINKNTSHSGALASALPGLTTLSRANQGPAQFVLSKGTIDHATNPYGTLDIATGPNKIAHFHIDGTGGSRTFHYTEISTPAAGKWIDVCEKHLCAVDTTNAPSTVYYSKTNDFDDFAGTGSGSVVLPEAIVGIKTFRDTLYIFGETSIYKLVNINDSVNVAVVAVTNNMGCADGYSIQELGGDLIFLSNDGFRSVAATERIDDVDLSSVARGIQPLVDFVIGNKSDYVISSTTVRGKNQYRLFYTNDSTISHGFCGTLVSSPDGGRGFQWSELRDIGVRSISSYYDSDEEEVVYHGSKDGWVYIHDSGNSFDGEPIEAEWQSPDSHYGDLGLRKTLHYFNAALTNEGPVALSVNVSFDFKSTQTTQPSSFSINLSGSPAVFGAAVFGAAVFGDLSSPLERVPLQGSGHSVAFRFYSRDTNPPHIIHGYHVEMLPSGRK